jgi:hypothetical protein
MLDSVNFIAVHELELLAMPMVTAVEDMAMAGLAPARRRRAARGDGVFMSIEEVSTSELM